VRGELRDNRPADEFVRDIITAEGSTFTEGPANFYRVAIRIKLRTDAHLGRLAMAARFGLSRLPSFCQSE